MPNSNALRILLVACASVRAVPAQSPAGSSAVSPPQPGTLANTIASQPLSVGDKFDYRLYRGFLLRGIIGAALGAGISQATNTPGAWGQGAGGYFRRVGSSLGGSVARQGFEFGIEAAIHEDPRFFPSTERGFKRRFGNVIKQVFIAKSDSGDNMPAYGRLISAFAAGQLQRSWMPSSNNAFGDGLITGALSIGGDAGINLLTEFFPPFRRRMYQPGSHKQNSKP